MTPPQDTPEPVEPNATQLGIQLVDTPQGQRLGITMTMLLPASDAKAFAAAIGQAADSMSSTGLIVAAGGSIG